ncbi:MAG: hypothetical protein SPJ16_02015 [Helicobacter sp.]|uniref:lipase family protein n=1 Tax=Helicobacter sp. TaxID=218 RepID=UPI002A908E1A|nr:hypothetical protein [Helicobacter sp.]MDY5949966.1 hypothetical protein [Helicobacter sp.]
MSNKQQIQKLRDNAELAQAAYGYFHFIGKEFKDKKDEQGNLLTITHTGILDLTYKGCKVKDTGLIFDDELKGDFAPLQAQNFFEKYDLLIHQPNTESGFSATLFQNKESKEYTLAIRSTEMFSKDMWITDLQLVAGVLPNQYKDMLLFYYQCIGKIPFFVDKDSMPQDRKSQEYKLWKKLYNRNEKCRPYITESLLKDSKANPTQDNFTPPINSTTKLTITGHSLGGCLAQLFALSFARYDTGDRGIIHEVYTYNSPGARKLKPYENKDMRALYPQAYENLMANYYFHKDKNEGIDIGIPTYHIETRHNEKANKYYIGSPIALLGEDIAGLYVMVNNKKFWKSHLITHLTRYLYLFEYLLSPINQNGQWNWDIDNLNRFIAPIKKLMKKLKMIAKEVKKKKTYLKLGVKLHCLAYFLILFLSQEIVYFSVRYLQKDSMRIHK